MIIYLIPVTVAILLTPLATGTGFFATLCGMIRCALFLGIAYAVVQLAAILTDSIP